MLAMFAAYTHLVDIDLAQGINLISYPVIIGLFLGAMMPPFLLGPPHPRRGAERGADGGGGAAAVPGDPRADRGKAKPDYKTCVDIATRGALRELLFPCSLAILVPVVVMLLLGKEALAGFLAGSILTGIIFALFMANAGGAWDNAKKYVETGPTAERDRRPIRRRSRGHGGRPVQGHRGSVPEHDDHRDVARRRGVRTGDPPPLGVVGRR